MDFVMDPRPRQSLADFDYDLPPDLIAQIPTTARAESRLLHVDGLRLTDLGVADLPRLVAPGDLVVFNDTRVIKARIIATRPSGGRVELLIERIIADDEAWVQLRASHAPKVGASLLLPGNAAATVLARNERFFRLRFDRTGNLVAWLDSHGEVPLPPYIRRAPVAADEARYQTVYAREPGAVAAPTAGLHVDDAMLAALAAAGAATAYVTLHVGAGTFLPVMTDDITQHRMHGERYSISAATAAAVAATRARGGRIVAIGTTSLRALESAAVDGGGVRAGEAETSLFVTAGFRFRVVDRLFTNFHLPKSTLLMLVSAFGGHEHLRAAYAHAVRSRYRFFSYGDAMLVEPASDRSD
jgi:S-adenosylmethionine:tRNA ribosyltransferase-isomerase